MELKIQKNLSPKLKYTDEDALGFGQIFTDNMLLIDYTPENGWGNARVVPEENFPMSLSSMVYHYGQATFEGLKAYKWEDGTIALFRPWENLRRMNRSNARLCIPEFDVDGFLEAMYELIRIEKNWIPSKEGTSLYIRPTIIATDPFLGVRPSANYLYFIILSPVGAYYKGGLAPTKILVESQYVRAAVGGLGEAKTPANYASSLIGSMKAKEAKCDQVLWLDARENKYIEEVGSMNIFFKINGEIITPELSGSILPGITRDSVITLAKSMGYTVSERKISIDEIIAAHSAGTLEEVFGTGTAAVVSPVGTLSYQGNEYVVSGGEMGETSKKFYDTLVGIQYGRIPDKFNWIKKIN